MSSEGTIVGAVHGSADDPEGLQQEIERTREHLGETVEALMAKADVKARAQDEAGRLIGRLKTRVIQARQQAAARAAQARRQAADKAAGPLQQATSQGRHVRRQAVDKAAATAKARRTPLLAGLGAVAAGLVGWLLFQRWRRRG